MNTRVAIVGLGAISLEHFGKLRRIEGVEVAGVCDLSATLIEAVRERFGAPRGFTDYGRMLEEVAPDTVHVLTPPQTHPRLVRAAIDAGAHVFVEKPIAPSWAEYVDMRDHADARGRMLVENYNYRFMDVVVEALEMVHSGQIGDLVRLDVGISVGLANPGGPYGDRDVPHFAHSLHGGALRNFASHPASMVAAFAGDFERVSVVERRLLAELPGADELCALVAGNGATSTVTITSHVKPGGMWVRALGSGGEIEVDVLSRRLHVDPAGGPLPRLAATARHGLGYLGTAATLVGRVLTSQQDYFEGFERLLRGFYAAVRDKAPAPLPRQEMDVANRLVEALFDSENRL